MFTRLLPIIKSKTKKKIGIWYAVYTSDTPSEGQVYLPFRMSILILKTSAGVYIVQDIPRHLQYKKSQHRLNFDAA